MNPALLLAEAGWPAGVGILILQLICTFLPAGEARDWQMYQAMGGLAGLLLCASALRSWFGWGFAGWQWLRAGLATYAIAAADYYLLPAVFDWPFALVWLAAGFAGYKVFRRSAGSAWRKAGAAFIAASGTLCLFSACFALHLGPLPVEANPEQRLMATLVTTVVYTITLLMTAGLVWCAMFNPGKPSPLAQIPAVLRAGRWLANLAALGVLVWLGFSVTGLGSYWPLHHWKAILEPADAVRAGGWLLWDTPAQYGFLQPLLIAAFPAANVWQSFYLINAGLLCGVYMALFHVLYRQYDSYFGFFLCMAVTVSLTTLLPSATIGDARLYPSGGPLRFIWGYLLLAYIMQASARGIRRFWGGHAIWLIGLFWAAESAALVTLVWLPSHALLRAGRHEAPLRAGALLKDFLLSALICLTLAFAAASAVAGYYKLMLGEWPDVRLGIIYLQSYKESSFTYAIETLRPAVVPLVFFFAAFSLARHIVLHAQPGGKALRAAAGSYAPMALIWAASSYYVSRSHDQNVVNALPAMALAFTALGASMPLLHPGRYAQAAFKIFFAGLLGGIVFVTFFSGNDLTVPDAPPPFVSADVARVADIAPAGLHELIKRAQMPEGARVQILEDRYIMPTLDLRPWLLPNTLPGYAAVLPLDDYSLLAERRARRLCEDGWVIERRDDPLANYPWIMAVIDRHYRQVGEFADSISRIRHFRPLAECVRDE